MNAQSGSAIDCGRFPRKFGNCRHPAENPVMFADLPAVPGR